MSVDEQYEMYKRCALCCLPGRQYGYMFEPFVFVCLACRAEGIRYAPIPWLEWGR